MPLQDFQPIIGLEVHAQMLTHSKIFCSCSTEFGSEPNRNTCAVCLGLPGVLPVLNRQVVEFATRTGLALECTVKPISVWSRKNYFYPDLPKGYQITQYDLPICEHGKLTISTVNGEKEIRIRRIHMEEDAGKNVHDASEGESLVDLNRAGVPLLEIVSEPDLRDADEVTEYLKALRDVLVYLGVNDGNLEEGSFRCDVNVSVMRKGATELGTRAELKNINSFRFIRQALEFEVARQVELIESGGKVVQETRLWDPARNQTRSMRSKEDAHDYRYFPEPDLAPLQLAPEFIEGVRATLPELPRAKIQRFISQYGLPEYDAKILTAERPMAEFFEACAARYQDAKKLSNWFLGEWMRLLKEAGENASIQALKFGPQEFAALLKAIDAGSISANAGKEVLGEMFRTGAKPEAVIAQKGLAQVSDVGAIEAAVDQVLAANAAEVEKFRGGNKKAYGFFVGQVMKAMKGKGNPQLVNEVLTRKLGG